MPQLNRLQELRDSAAVGACGKTVESVSVGIVTNELATSRGETLIGGEAEVLEFHFSDGSVLRVESRCSWQGEGSMLVVR
jgi:hypothetical protein